MTWCRLHAIPIALLFFTTYALSDQPADDKRLSGKWIATSGSWSGKNLTAEQARACVLTITLGDPRAVLRQPKLDLAVPDKLVGYQIWTTSTKLETRYITSWQDFGLTLDRSSTPASFSALKLVGIKAASFAGIYRFDGETLTVCINFNRLVPLPKEFKSPRGSEVMLLKLKRCKLP